MLQDGVGTSTEKHRSKRKVETTLRFVMYAALLVFRCVLLATAVILYAVDKKLLDIRDIFDGNWAGHVFPAVVFVFLCVDFITKLTTRSKIAVGSLKQYRIFQIPTQSTTGKNSEELFNYIRELAQSGKEKVAGWHSHPSEYARTKLSKVREQLGQGTSDAIAAAKRTLRDVDVLRVLPFKDEDLDVSQEIRSHLRFRRLGEIAGVAVFWVVLNAAVAMGLHILGLLDGATCLVWTLCYFVFDMICVVFFCPLQLLFMRNRCCTTCQIFNWDAIMVVTPLLFAPCLYSFVLIAFGLVILLRWEVTAFVYPERFFEETNAALSCANCKDKLCKLRPPILDPLAPTAQRRGFDRGDTRTETR